MTEINENKKLQSYEFDLVVVFHKVWKGKRTIFISMLVFFVLAVIIIIGTPKQYKSEVTLLVESSSGTNGMGGLLQQFGGLAGVNFGSGAGADALNPQLYPDVIKSTPFLLEIMNQKVTESKYDSTLTIAQYLDRHTKSSITGVLMGYSIGLPGKIIGWIKGKPKTMEQKILKNGKALFRLTQKETDMIEVLSGIVSVKQNKTDNKLVISVEVQDPAVAAQLTDSVVSTLTRYVADYKTQKAKNVLTFIQGRYNDAETKYLAAQRALAVYRDQNKNVILATTKTEEERLQSEYNLAFNVYNTLSQQFEQAKIKVQQETPVFTILNPAQVPLRKSEPQTITILVIFIFLGGLVGIGIIYGGLIYKSYFNKNFS